MPCWGSKGREMTLTWGLQVRGQSLLPAAAMVEAAFATCKITVEKISKKSVPTLGQGSIPAPLIWTPSGAAALHVHISSEAGVPQVSVQSATAGNKTRPVLHLHAKLGQALSTSHASNPHIPVLQTLVGGRILGRSVVGCPCAALSNAWEASTYHAYPPALDACMHVGAIASQSPEAEASQLRIPSGFALYTVTAQTLPRSAWACASDLRIADDGSALSTYSLAAPAPSLLLRDLTARHLRKPQPSDPRISAPGGLRDLLYGITWKAADPWPLATPKGRRFGHQRMRWNVDGKVVAGIGNPPVGTAVAGTAAAVKATVTAVALSQMVIKMRPGRIVHVITGGGGRHAWESGLGRQAITGIASSAVAAVVRTAQQESSGNQWSAVDVGVALAGSAPSASLPADGTSTLASSTVYKPQLYQSENAPVLGAGLLPHTGAERVGAVVIGGGAGGIGSLLCLWEGHNHGRRLYLLSRTAHGGEPQHALAQHDITVAKCDVAAQEDVAGFHRDLGGVHSGSPALAMFHAGGVLRDATLPNLSSGAVRAVFAPKVGGILAMQSALTRLPVNATSVFSSTGALLGPMGQANYGAANAAANAWAANQQSQGRSHLEKACSLPTASEIMTACRDFSLLRSSCMLANGAQETRTQRV